MADVVAVVVATFGSLEWRLVADRAVQSAVTQTRMPDSIVQQHGPTLASARNSAADLFYSDWLIFVDADDEIEPGYVEAMLAAGEGDIRRPITRGIHPSGAVEDPAMIPRRDINRSNFAVIGSMVRTELFHKVGGFDEYPVLEDWALWLKCWNEGAEIVDVPEAVYRVHINQGSRNTDSSTMRLTYDQIRRDLAGRRPWISQ